MKFKKLLCITSFVQDAPTIKTYVPKPETKPAIKPVEKDRIGKALDRAADLIEKRGWTAGVLEDNRGRLCALGALKKATRIFGVIPTPLTKSIEKQAQQRLVRKLDIHRDSFLLRHMPAEEIIPGWNDSPFRRKEEVIHALRKAANSER